MKKTLGKHKPCQHCEMPIWPNDEWLYVFLSNAHDDGGDALLHAGCVTSWMTTVLEVFMSEQSAR